MWDIILKIHAPDLDAPEQEFTIVDGVCNVESENTIDFDAGIHA